MPLSAVKSAVCSSPFHIYLHIFALLLHIYSDKYVYEFEGEKRKKNICAVITACKLDNAVSYDQYGVRAKCIWFNRYLGTRLVEEKQSFRLRSLKDMEQAVFSQSTECMKYEGNRPNINAEKLFPQTHNETKKITQTRSGDCPVDKLNGRITIFFCRKLLCVEWYILCATFGTFALINLLLCLPSQVMCRTVYGMILSERDSSWCMTPIFITPCSPNNPFILFETSSWSGKVFFWAILFHTARPAEHKTNTNYRNNNHRTNIASVHCLSFSGASFTLHASIEPASQIRKRKVKFPFITLYKHFSMLCLAHTIHLSVSWCVLHRSKQQFLLLLLLHCE